LVLNLRNLPLSMRKANLQRLLVRHPDGIYPTLSKVRSARTYFARRPSSGLRGWSRSIAIDHIAVAVNALGQIKNRQHPAMHREL
jgi:hypothetical protein